ncbi:MAG: hypothetical protein EAZ89_21525 [Bacteroidetes bacterium]|nr:MAG: hypothetical protein EAZ89_21525 [Bacteroidota bacterium]
MNTYKLAAFLLLLSAALSTSAQSLLIDVSAGRSRSDDAYARIALRSQLSPRVRLGLEVQTGSARYRFIGAKPFTDGQVLSLRIPVSVKFYESETFEANFFLSPGYRRLTKSGEQGPLASSTSTAVSLEPGIMTRIGLTERLSFHSGFSVPMVYEIRPERLFENELTLIQTGLSYRVGTRALLFARVPFGGAYGADGDAEKYFWATEIGFRFALGGDLKNASLEF